MAPAGVANISKARDRVRRARRDFLIVSEKGKCKFIKGISLLNALVSLLLPYEIWGLSTLQSLKRLRRLSKQFPERIEHTMEVANKEK